MPSPPVTSTEFNTSALTNHPLWRWPGGVLLGALLVFLVRCRELVLGTEQGDLGLEGLEVVERPVDAGEAQVGHLVQLAQRRQHGHPHLVGLDLGNPAGPDRLLDPLRQQSQVVLGHRAPLAGLADTGQDLLAAERLARAGALCHAQARGLHRGEAPTALGTLPAPADRRAVVGGAAVDHAAVAVAAERAVHPGLLSAAAPRSLPPGLWTRRASRVDQLGRTWGRAVDETTTVSFTRCRGDSGTGPPDVQAMTAHLFG